MSADNTVAVFSTPDGKSYVIEVQCIESRFLLKTDQLDPLWHVDMLSKAEVYTSEDAAICAAFAQAEDHYVEYGVCRVKLPHTLAEFIEQIEPVYHKLLLGVIDINGTKPNTAKRRKSIYLENILRSLTSLQEQLLLKS